MYDLKSFGPEIVLVIKVLLYDNLKHFILHTERGSLLKMQSKLLEKHLITVIHDSDSVNPTFIASR